jgi:hypothetical protein
MLIGLFRALGAVGLFCFLFTVLQPPFVFGSAYSGGGGGGAVAVATNITSASATCFSVGPNGTTNPSFLVDCSAASAASGIKITAAASGSGATLETIGGTNETLTIKPKGASGNLNLGAAVAVSININTVTAGSINLQNNSSTKLAVSQKGSTWTHSARTSGVTPNWALTGGTDTALTASTEAPVFQLDMGQSKQHSTGALTLQRFFLVNPPTQIFVGASVLAEAATMGIAGPPDCTTNATCTQAEALLIGTRALAGTVTAAFGLVSNAPTGATTNYAAKFSGVNGVLFVPPATQTVASTDTIVADACGGVKNITAAGAVTTNTTDTFTAPAAGNTGCSMMVCNVGATNAITLDKNSHFFTVGGIDLVLLANSCVGVTQSTGTEWRQTSAQLISS